MRFKTEGIVLRAFNYGEADLIVTYLTADRGIIKGFAKSPRKIKSRFGSSLEPFTHARVSFWGKEHSNLPKIVQSDIIQPFSHVREDINDFLRLSHIIELLLSLYPEGISNKKIFYLFLQCLSYLEQAAAQIFCAEVDKNALYLLFKIRLIAILGYAPMLKQCGRCGQRGLFYPSEGAVLCVRCAPIGARPMQTSKAAVSFYEHGLTWPLSNLMRVKPSADIVGELIALLDEHLRHVLGKELKTAGFNIR